MPQKKKKKKKKNKKNVDKGKKFEALSTDLSEAFHCLPHDLIIVKRNAYGFSFKSTRLIHCYLSDRRQKFGL